MATNQITPPPPPPGVIFVESPPPPPPGVKFKEDGEPSTWSEKLGMKGPTFDYNPVKAAVDLTEGAWSGAASTVLKGGDLIRRGLGMKRVIDEPAAKQAMKAPPTIPGQIGHYGEQAAEFAIPLSGVAKAAKALPLAGRIAAEGTASGGIAALQSGGDPTTTGIAAGVGAVAPGIGPGIRAGRAGLKSAMLSGTSWKEAITKGLRPASRNLKFEADIPLAMRDIKAAETKTGQAIAESDNPLKAFIENVKAAKKAVWSEYEAIAGPKAAQGIDLTQVANAKIAAIPTKTKVLDPEGYKRLVDEANKYRRRFTMQEAEDFLQTTNAEAESYFAKYPSARNAAAAKNPDTAGLVAEGDALRNTIYKELDSASAGAVPRSIKQRYGALMDMLGEAERRYNVAARQAVNSLSEQVGGWRTAGLLARGLLRGATKDVPGAAKDFTEALATREIARALKEANTSNELIRHAFKNYRAIPNPSTGAVSPTAVPVAPGPYVAPGQFNVPSIPPAIPPSVGPSPARVITSRPAPTPLVSSQPGARVRPPGPGAPGAPPTPAGGVPVSVGPSPLVEVNTPATPGPLVGPSAARPLRGIESPGPLPTSPLPPLNSPPVESTALLSPGPLRTLKPPPAPLETPTPVQALLPVEPPPVALQPAAAKAGATVAPPPLPPPFKYPLGNGTMVTYEALSVDEAGNAIYRFTGPDGFVREDMMSLAKLNELASKGTPVGAAQPPPMAPGPIMQ